ncbi:hypothetical protein CBL_20265 [Carabus blaptoides fortunei]
MDTNTTISYYVDDIEVTVPFKPRIKKIQTALNHVYSCEPLEGTKWQWKEDEVKAFQAVKEVFVRVLVLMHSIPDRPYIRQDSSGYGIGEVLAQEDERGEVRAIGFKFRTHIQGVKLIIRTDHQALKNSAAC